MGGKSLDLVSLSQLLAEKKALTKTNLILIEQFKEKWGVSTYDAIVETRLLTERELTDILADYFRVTRLYTISESEIFVGAFDEISFRDARHYSVFPMGADSGTGPIKLVLGDPTMKDTLEFISRSQRDYDFAVYEKSLVQAAVIKYYPISYQLPSLNSRGVNEEK